jgi:hypothetical protein
VTPQVHKKLQSLAEMVFPGKLVLDGRSLRNLAFIVEALCCCEQVLVA